MEFDLGVVLADKNASPETIDSLKVANKFSTERSVFAAMPDIDFNRAMEMIPGKIFLEAVYGSGYENFDYGTLSWRTTEQRGENRTKWGHALAKTLGQPKDSPMITRAIREVPQRMLMYRLEASKRFEGTVDWIIQELKTYIDRSVNDIENDWQQISDKIRDKLVEQGYASGSLQEKNRLIRQIIAEEYKAVLADRAINS